MTLLDEIEAATAAGSSPAVAAVVAEPSSATRRMILLLSVALVVPLEELDDMVRLVWPGEPEPEAPAAAIQEWPFVRAEAGGLRMVESMSGPIALHFRAADPEGFQRAHELLCAREEAKEADASPLETWFIRGRTAYFLAGLDPDRSIEGFEEVFRADVPTLDRRAARMWVTSLVLHQEPFLATRHREISFYRAFRDYVTGRLDEAERGFESVLAAGSASDPPTVISTHLLGVLTLERNLQRSIALFSESVDTAQRIGMDRGEVMARNSLAWAWVRHAADASADAREPLESARELAELNLEIATGLDDDHLLTWCEYTKASINWLALTALRTEIAPAVDEADSVVSSLQRVTTGALRVGDVETAVLASNDAACVLRDVRRDADALQEIAHTLELISEQQVSAGVLRRLAQTAGSVKTQTLLGRVRAQANNVLGTIHDMQVSGWESTLADRTSVRYAAASETAITA